MVDTWNPSRFFRYVQHVEQEIGRELDADEFRICVRAFYTSTDGFKKTRQRIRRGLAAHWEADSLTRG